MSWRIPYAAAAITWGSSFWFIKVGLTSFSAVQVGFLRVAIGALTLLAFSAITGTPFVRDWKVLRHLFVVALVLNSAPAVLFAYGETEISSVLASIMNATTPLTTLLVTMLAFREQRPTRAQILGLLVGFVGVLTALGVWKGLGAGELLGIAACAVAVIGYGISFPYIRRHLAGLTYSSTQLVTAQVTIAALQLVPVIAILDPRIPLPSPSAGAAMLALGALGTGFAFVWSNLVIRRSSATVASTVTYWTPLVAMVAGAAFLGEHIAWHQPVGVLLVLSGVALSQGRFPGRPGTRAATSR